MSTTMKKNPLESDGRACENSVNTSKKDDEIASTIKRII